MLSKNVLLNWYFSIKKKLRKIRLIFKKKIDFERHFLTTPHYTNSQNSTISGHAVSQLWQILTLNLCGYWSRVWSRVKKVIIFNLVISVVPYSYPILWIHEANLYKHAKSLHEIIKLYLPRNSFVYMHHRASFTVFARKDAAVPKDLYQVQVNFFQKHLFLHQLTHNMTKDCPLNYQFSTWKLQSQNMLCTQIVFCFCFDIQNNLCTQHALSL